MSVLSAFSLAGLGLGASLAPPVLAAEPPGTGAAPGTTLQQVISVTITRVPTTTTTTTLPPTTTTQTTQPTTQATTQATAQPPALVAAPKTAATTSPPPQFAFTGAPITAELVLAAVLLVAGAVLLGVVRRLKRRRT